MKTLYACPDEFTAGMIRNLLESGEIPAQILNQHSRYVPLCNPGRPGIEVVISEADYPEAARLLLAHGYQPLGIEDIRACPACGSWDTAPELKKGRETSKLTMMFLLLFRSPVLGVKSQYRCRACGEKFFPPLLR